MSPRARRAGLTVRTRMLAAFLGLSALALLLAGGAAWFLQRGQIDARIDESLTRSANELAQLAESGLNPVTGEPFTSAEDVVVASIQLTVPAHNEGILGLREGRTPRSDGVDGLRVVQVLEAAERSLREGGRPVAVDEAVERLPERII